MEIIYREERDRFFKGDRYVRPYVRKLLGRRQPYVSGMQRVVENFLLGLQQKNIQYHFNRSSLRIGRSAKVLSFGLGMLGVQGLRRSNPIVAAIGFPYPWDAPDLCRQYDIRKYLQHSTWSLELARSAGIYPDDIFELWPAGINTDFWTPSRDKSEQPIAALLYCKFPPEDPQLHTTLLQPVREFLTSKGYSYSEIAYGKYTPETFRSALHQARTMIFFSPHETQGFAYQECLSCGVPVMAWDQGFWLDPARLRYNRPTVRATSVPFFDERCGVTFTNLEQFLERFEDFYDRAVSDKLNPREYILENLSIERSTERLLDIYIRA